MPTWRVPFQERCEMDAIVVAETKEEAIEATKAAKWERLELRGTDDRVIFEDEVCALD